MSKRRVIRKVKREVVFTCDKCDKSFSGEQYLKSHQAKNPDCDIGFECEKCEKSFPNNSKLQSHLKRKTPCAPEEVPVIENDNPTNKCYLCNKELSSKSSLNRHIKSCATSGSVLTLMKRLDRMQTSIDSQIAQPVVNNNTINLQQNNFNIVVMGFGKEDLSMLDVQEIKRLVMDNAQQFIPMMIEKIHVNPEHPERRNIFYNSPTNNAMVFIEEGGNKTWKIRDMTDLSVELTTKVKKHVINNQELNGLFNDASTDKDWDKFSTNIHIINGIEGDEDAIIEANKVMLAKNNDFCENQQQIVN